MLDGKEAGHRGEVHNGIIPSQLVDHFRRGTLTGENCKEIFRYDLVFTCIFESGEDRLSCAALEICSFFDTVHPCFNQMTL